MIDKFLGLGGRNAEGKAEPVSVNEGKLEVTDNAVLAKMLEVAVGIQATNEKLNGTVNDKIEEIVDAIGVENIKLFLPFLEDNEKYYDLFNKNILFAPSTAGQIKRVKGGPLGHYLAFPNSQNPAKTNTWLEEQPFSRVLPKYDATFAPKYAQKIKFTSETQLSKVVLPLKLVGSLPKAKIKVSICVDDKGKPGKALANRRMFYDQNKTTQSIDCSPIQTYTSYVGFPVYPVLDLERNTDYWIVLEYHDSTGVDANNYITWRYENVADGVRASWNGVSWTTTAGDSFAYSLYDNDLQLQDDFTILLPFKMIDTTTAIQSLLDMPSLLRESAFRIRLTSGRIYINFTDSSNTIMEAIWSNKVNQGWNVIAVTFSKEKSLDKLCVYLNGKLITEFYETLGASPVGRYGLLGNGGKSLSLLSQPLALGNRISRAGGAYNPFGGYMAPIILTNNELSSQKVAQVSDLILRGSKEEGLL